MGGREGAAHEVHWISVCETRCVLGDEAWIIFQLSKKNGHEAIVGIMVRSTLLHERICLIKEQHSLEMLGNLKYAFKLLFQYIGIAVVNNKLTGRYLSKSVSPWETQRVILTE